jgi:hypothetical protein
MAQQDPVVASETAAEASGANAKAGGRRGGSRDPKVFVLLRELSEVHLLLDNLSANPTTTVTELASDERLAAHKLTPEWIEEVCRISWPPDGSNEERAEDAALLIRAKDFLNRLSHPASGSTIAFTLLVTQEDTEEPKRWWQWWRKADDGGAKPETNEHEQETAKPKPLEPTRSSLARTAYPDLVGKALGFRRAMWWISVGLVAALVVTCTLSWYVAYGNAALAELATARDSLAEAQTRVNSAETADWTQAADGPQDRDGPATGNRQQQRPVPRPNATGNPPQPAPAPAPNATGNPTQPAPALPGNATAPPSRPFSPYCDTQPYLNPTQSQLCGARLRAETALVAVEWRLAHWLCWDWVANCDTNSKARDAPSRAAAFANILGSAVLPFLYGLLGAGAAVIRSMSRKIRASRLSPRDLVLSVQQLALGAVVGACIGLFVVAPGSDETGESLLGPVTLSASAISFVAGFGVEAVFQALEELIKRIFNLGSAPPANRTDGTTAS